MEEQRGFYRTPKLFSEELSAGYPASEALVLHGLSLEIGEGEIVALVGPNGSGKSTLLRALGRVLKPRHGVVYLEGRAMREWPTREVARKLALLPQGPTLAADMSVRELVWLGRSPHQGMLGLPTPADEAAVRWRSTRRASPRWRSAASRRSPAVSGSGSGWRWRWPSSRRCFCWTSRRPSST